MIICLGLPKSGTLSLTEAFNSVGYNAAHWGDKYGPFGPVVLDAIQRGVPMLRYITAMGYDAFTQLDYCNTKTGFCFFPQVYLYDVLYRQYPDAYFILNYRPLDKHDRSIRAWGDYADRLAYFGIRNIGSFINDHNKTIAKFFLGKERFLMFDIETDGDEKLSNFIGKEIKIPHLNKTDYAHA